MNQLSNDQQCPDCGRFANRGVTIDALIIKDGKILLIKRGVDPFKGYWAFPGGYVGWDETVEDAVKREVREELGLDVTELSQIGLYSDPNRHPRQCIDVAFSVIVDGVPSASDDAAEFKYFELNDLPSDLAFDHKRILDDFRSMNT